MKRFLLMLLLTAAVLLCPACGADEPASSVDGTTTSTTAETTAVETTTTVASEVQTQPATPVTTPTTTLAALPETTDDALVKAVDWYMRITAQNDTAALYELPASVQALCSRPMDDYAQYMREQPFYGAPEGTQWHIVSVENPFGDNSFDVVIEYDGDELMITLTKEGDTYIIDELLLYFDSMTFEMDK